MMTLCPPDERPSEVTACQVSELSGATGVGPGIFQSCWAMGHVFCILQTSEKFSVNPVIFSTIRKLGGHCYSGRILEVYRSRTLDQPLSTFCYVYTEELGELMALSTDGFCPGDDRGEMKQVILQPTSEPDFQTYAGTESGEKKEQRCHSLLSYTGMDLNSACENYSKLLVYETRKFSAV